ncbi:MAG: oxidoreductase [Candidatus Hydrogenedentes bacterium]|nr:oxidoreductase [Candidatus Hydrogenedentota bacterium]
MKLVELDISNPYKAKVKSNTLLTPPEADAEIRHLVLEIDDTMFHYVEGQSIAVIVPGPHAFGNESHLRLYSIASSRGGENGYQTEISICVRRCFYIDEVSGERYPGVASNYLCDLAVGSEIIISGPYGRQFVVPRNKKANLLLIGMGTGIAPFRAFVRHIYEDLGGWEGQVRLFYGAQSGMEMLYMNDQQNDLTQYYDEATFKAFEAVSPRPHFGEPAALDQALEEHAEEVWAMLNEPNTYVYLAGLEAARTKMEKAISKMAGGEEQWEALKKRLQAEHRLSELIY